MASDGSLLFDTGVDSSGFENGLKSLAGLAAKAAAAVTAAFTAAASAAVNVGSSFTASMSQVSATMGITRMSEEYETLSAAAEEMGAATKFSATQAGDALNYLALAGYDANKAVSALPTVLNTAAAGGLDLAYASDLITDSMSALGLGMDELESFSDKLAKTSQKSNTNIAQLGEAILTVGGTAKTLSGGVTELNTMLGLIADNGIKGAEGGTALRNIILSLSAPTDTAAAAMERLNISAFDGQGKLRDLSEVFADFNTALAPLSDQQKTQALNEIFNKVDLKAVNALLGTSAERFDELTGYIENCNGAAAEMAKTMDDNLTGDLTILSSALEGLGIAAFDKFEDPMRSAVQTVTEDISKLTSEIKDGALSAQFDKISESAGRFITAVGEFAANDLLPGLINSMSEIIEHGNVIISVVAGIGAAVAALKIGPVIVGLIASVQTANVQLALLAGQFGSAAVSATALGGGLTLTEIMVAAYNKQIPVATAVTAAFNTVIKANPIMAIASVIGIVVSALGIFISQVKKSKSAVEEAAEETNKYAEAMENVRQNAQDNVDKSNAEVGVIREKAKRYEELRQRINYLTKGEMEEFKSLCSELQEILPEGTEIINEQTGAYNDLADSIDLVCQKMEKNAVLNYKYKEYEEAAGQNYDIDNQLKRAEEWAKENNHFNEAYRDIYINDEHSQLNAFCEIEFGLSYAELEKIRDQNQVIIDEYYQLYQDTYNELNAAEDEFVDNTANNHRLAGQEYAKNIEAANTQMLADLEKNTKKIEAGFEKLDHEYNTGIIKTTQELYEKKKAMLDKYGTATCEDQWKFYEEIYGYEKEFAEESVKTEKERQKNVSTCVSAVGKLVSEGLEQNGKQTKEVLEKSLKTVKNNLSSIVSSYKTAMSDLTSNIASYKNKLLSVGDIFSVEETEKNGRKVKAYTINNIEEQMSAMKKYHSYVKSLKASGVSQGLLEELTSLDFEDGAVFGKYLSGLSDEEFSKINSFYSERDALADELSKDLYAGEAEKLNSILQSCVNDALEALPPAAQTAGKKMLAGIMDGMTGSEDLTERMNTFMDGFSEVYDKALEEIDLGNGFSAAIGGINAYAEGQNLGKQLVNGFDDELKKYRAEISMSQTATAAGLASGGAAQAAQTAPAGGKNSDKITVDTTNNITVQIDGETVSRTAEKHRTQKERRTG